MRFFTGSGGDNFQYIHQFSDYQNTINFYGKYMTVFIYIEKKTLFSLLLELGNQCLMWILSSGSPEAYLTAYIQGVELEGNINSSCQIECSQENLFTMDLIPTLHVLTSCTEYCMLLFPVP